jgi:hypothetical protein
MIDYNLLILSPNEFENISRDLLQKKLSVFIESFTTGRDGGIDFRYSNLQSKEVIIQAKRYKDYSSLFNHLKGEAEKVKKLNPNRYILTTSVGLTPQNKKKIETLFAPFVINTEDILGKEDLNNLLSIHKEIEHKYYKLWLSSTNVLEKVLHSKIYNQSAFELEAIKDEVKLYVQNESFNEALKILKQNRYVIISGIPGIGKTTLARILAMTLLSGGFEDFVFLNDSIDDAYEFFAEGKKQVFFFDDFLGTNFFDNDKSSGEDSKIVKFILQIKKSPEKLLILTTREYILNQAKVSFESFNISNIEVAKCILDLSSYTNIIKAQIIYNHLFFADVPIAHLQDLVKDQNYVKLVHHRNYSPRIIETIINRKIWNHIPENQFAKALISYFDNPESVWLYSFENSLDKFSQYSLLVLLTMGTPVLIDDWESAIKEFLKLNNYKFLIAFDSIKFKRAIKELENTFIRTQKDQYHKVAVEYQNPSVQDFLVYYLKDKEDLIKSLLEGSIFTDQFYRIFTTEEIKNFSNDRKLFLNENLLSTAIKRLAEIFDTLRSSRVTRLKYLGTENITWYQSKDYIYEFISRINSEFSTKNVEARDLVYKEFQKRLKMKSFSYSEQKGYMQLLSELDRTKLECDEDQIIKDFVENMVWIDNIKVFGRMKEIFPKGFSVINQDENFRIKIEEIVTKEAKSVKNPDIITMKDDIELVENMFGIDFSNQKDELHELEKKFDETKSDVEDEVEEINAIDDGNKELNESQVIDEIFNSLVDK